MSNEIVTKVLQLLDEHYPQHVCFLDYNKPYELLLATILSAQCTDVQVNRVTEKLFVKYTSLEDFAGANLVEMEEDVRTTGFFHNKAKSIILTARALLECHAGELPSDIGNLTKLPGVGRKTANLVRGHIFGIPSIVVDTHVGRVSRRLGFTKHTDPKRVEYDLMEVLPESHWIRYNTQIIALGREICGARKPSCDACFLAEQCATRHLHIRESEEDQDE